MDPVQFDYEWQQYIDYTKGPGAAYARRMRNIAIGIFILSALAGIIAAHYPAIIAAAQKGDVEKS